MNSFENTEESLSTYNRKCNPCADIMESVALVEAALSHILNAEGEKMQKIISTTNDIEKILCVNKEINKTIVNVTHLEHILYAKLSAITDCCGFEDLCCNECHVCCDKNNTHNTDEDEDII